MFCSGPECLPNRKKGSINKTGCFVEAVDRSEHYSVDIHSMSV